VPFNDFTRAFGSLQGRVVPVGFSPDGDYAFVLGSNEAGMVGHLNIGDYVEVSQAAILTGLKYIRCVLYGRPPASLPVGASWKFSLRVAGVERARHFYVAGTRVRERHDLAANVSKLTGSQTLAFRLEVIAA
jgi:hypothetical protein